MKKLIFLIYILLLTNSIFSAELRTIIFTDYFGQIEPTTDYESVRQRNYIRPELSFDLFDYTTELTISAEYYYDYFADEQTPDPFNILRECYLAFYLSWGDIIFGQKFTNKGKADVFSPLNIFNASYRELYSLDEPYQSKRADAGLELNYYINDDSSIEFIYIPFSRPDNQGIGTLSLEIDDEIIQLEKESDPYLLEENNSFFLTYNRYNYNFDLQITYGNYIDGNYNYDFDDVNNILDKTFNRVQTLGGSVSTSIGSVAVTEELAFNLTEDFNGENIGIKNSDITLNTQLMRPLFGRTFAQLNIVYQHIFNYSSDGELSTAINAAQLQPTDNILFFIGHLHDSFLREKLYVALNMGFFFSPEVYLAPRVNYKISDNITLETGIDMYTGEYAAKLLEKDLGGDNFFVRLKYEY